jgi:peptidoglycan/LPS O-acetylase OafA/YrhL
VPDTNARPRLTDLWLLPFYPHAHFWYLQSLFVVFIAVAALEVSGALARPRSYLVVLVLAACLAGLPLRGAMLFGFSGACYLLCFFLWGLGLHRFRRAFVQPAILVFALALGVAAVALRQLALSGLLNLGTRQQAGITVVGGLALTAFLVHRIPISRLLVRLGHYSYSIYLMHVFGTAATRIVLHRLGVGSVPLQLLGGVLMGTAAPIAAEEAFDRFGLTRLLFLGRAYTQRGTDAVGLRSGARPAPAAPAGAL